MEIPITWPVPGCHLFLSTVRALLHFSSLLSSSADNPWSGKQLYKDALREWINESQKGHVWRRSHCRPNSLHCSKFSALVQMSNHPPRAASGFVRKEVTHSRGSCCNLGGLPGEGERHTQPDLWWAHSLRGTEDAIHRKRIREPRVGWTSHLGAGSRVLPPLSCK